MVMMRYIILLLFVMRKRMVRNIRIRGIIRGIKGIRRIKVRLRIYGVIMRLYRWSICAMVILSSMNALSIILKVRWDIILEWLRRSIRSKLILV
jgi:hypothetical protein